MLRAWSEVWQSGETEIVEREKSAGYAGKGETPADTADPLAREYFITTARQPVTA